MPVTMNLVENGYVMNFVITDPWDVRDITTYYSQQQSYLDQATHQLYTFIDMTGTKKLPSGILAARQRAPSIVHPKSGYIVFTGANGFVQTLADTGFKVMHYDRVKFFKTNEEAWTFLRQIIEHQVAPVITEKT